MVDLCSRSMDRRLGLWWTESIPFSFGMVYVHRVHVSVADEGKFPHLLPRRAPTGGELTGEPL